MVMGVADLRWARILDIALTTHTRCLGGLCGPVGSHETGNCSLGLCEAEVGDMAVWMPSSINGRN